MSADVVKNITSAEIDDWIHVSIKKPINYIQCPSPQITPNHLLPYKQYIILIDEQKGIYQHNVYDEQYSWIKLADIPDNVPMGDWSSCINQLTGKIYICIIQPWLDSNINEFAISDEDIASVAIYDIPNNKWSINPNSWMKSIECLTFKGPLSIQYIPSPHNEVQIIDTGIGNHSIYNDKTQSFKPIDDALPFIKEWDNLIYIATIQKLCVFGYNHTNIYSVDIINENKTDFKWKKSMIKLPNKYLNALMVFNGIIMFWPNDYDTINKSIWFLDVNRNELMKSDYIIPDNFNIDTLIKSEDFYLHGIENNNLYHIKINLFEILPPELINSYIDRIEILIAGFLKDMQVPTDLINLLRSFLPSVL